MPYMVSYSFRCGYLSMSSSRLYFNKKDIKDKEVLWLEKQMQDSVANVGLTVNICVEAGLKINAGQRMKTICLCVSAGQFFGSEVILIK